MGADRPSGGVGTQHLYGTLDPAHGSGARWQQIRALPETCTFAEAEKYLALLPGFGRGNRTWAANPDFGKPLHVTGVRTNPARPRDFMAEGHGAAIRRMLSLCRAARAVSQDRVAQAGNEPWIAEPQVLGRSSAGGVHLRIRGRSSARDLGGTALEGVAKRPIWTAQRQEGADLD